MKRATVRGFVDIVANTRRRDFNNRVDTRRSWQKETCEVKLVHSKKRCAHTQGVSLVGHGWLRGWRLDAHDERDQTVLYADLTMKLAFRGQQNDYER